MSCLIATVAGSNDETTTTTTPPRPSSSSSGSEFCDDLGIIRQSWLDDFFSRPPNDAPDCSSSSGVGNVPSRQWFHDVSRRLAQQGVFSDIGTALTRAFAFAAAGDSEHHEEQQESSTSVARRLEETLSWMGENRRHMVELLKQTSLCSEQDSLLLGLRFEAGLCITACFERALGDIYFSRKPGEPVPFLFRDTLASRVMSEAIGVPMVRFLQLLVGSVNSLNVRNLLWHGFLMPREMPWPCVLCLVSCACCIGRQLQEQLVMRRQQQQQHQHLVMMDAVVIKHRPVLREFPHLRASLEQQQQQQHHVDKQDDDDGAARFLTADFVAAELDNLQHQAELLAEDGAPDDDDDDDDDGGRRDAWRHATRLLRQGRWFRSVVVLLPLIESAMRRAFAKSVAESSPLLLASPGTAHLKILRATWDTKYVTMDEMLAQDVDMALLSGSCCADGHPSSSRLVRNPFMSDVLTENAAAMFRDVYHHLHGPRVRDAVSHFDCDAATSVDESIAICVAVSACVVLLVLISPPPAAVAQSTSTVVTTTTDTDSRRLFSDGSLRILCFANTQYVPSYHVKQMLRRTLVDECYPKIRDLLLLLSSLMMMQGDDELSVPPNDDDGGGGGGGDDDDDDYGLDDDISSRRHHLARAKLSFLFRPRKETEITSLLLRVATCLSLLLSNASETLQKTSELAASRKLRSRQRKTFGVMLRALPRVVRETRRLCDDMAACVLKMEDQGVQHDDEFPVDYCLRWGKAALKVAENNAVNVRKDKNQWAEALALFDELRGVSTAGGGAAWCPRRA